MPRKTTFDLFLYQSIKDNKISLCQDLFTIEKTDSDLKMHALYYAIELPVNFCNLAQHAKTTQKNYAYSLSIRVQTTINHISIFTFYVFSYNINVKKKLCFLEPELKKALHDTLMRAAWYGLLSTSAN